MNNFYFKPKILLSGQEAPFTGDYINITLARNSCFTVFSSGENVSGNVTLQYKSPFFENEGVSFYTFTGLSSGYADPIFLTTPMSEVRAIADGTGNYWVGINIQN
jgi:hypothetical protein